MPDTPDEANRHEPTAHGAPPVPEDLGRQAASAAKNLFEPVSEPSAELDRVAFEVIGAALEVHRTLGPGYLESVYEQALCIELRERGIPFVRQRLVPILYRGETVGQHRIDLVIDGRLIVELKTVDQLAPIHVAQMISYLKAGSCQLGLLVNFNVRRLQQGVRRVIWNEP